MLVRQRAADAVGLLRHDIDPAALIPAREPRDGAAPGHVVEHRDVLGHPDRVGGGQHDPELPDPDALRLHREIQVEQNRVLRHLEAFDVEMMLGETDRVIAKPIRQNNLLGQFLQHALIEIGAHARHALLDFRAAADTRQVEQ